MFQSRLRRMFGWGHMVASPSSITLTLSKWSTDTFSYSMVVSIWHDGSAPLEQPEEPPLARGRARGQPGEEAHG